MKDATHVRCERRVPQPAVEPRPWAQRGARSALTASQGANGADAAHGASIGWPVHLDAVVVRVPMVLTQSGGKRQLACLFEV